jgi:hypothetical protein
MGVLEVTFAMIFAVCAIIMWLNRRKQDEFSIEDLSKIFHKKQPEMLLHQTPSGSSVVIMKQGDTIVDYEVVEVDGTGERAQRVIVRHKDEVISFTVEQKRVTRVIHPEIMYLTEEQQDLVLEFVSRIRRLAKQFRES